MKEGGPASLKAGRFKGSPPLEPTRILLDRQTGAVGGFATAKVELHEPVVGRLAQQRSRTFGELRLAQMLRRLPREDGARCIARDVGQGETLGDLAPGRVVIRRRPPHPILGRIEELFVIEALELHANDEAFPERTERQPVDGVVEQVEGAYGNVPGDLLGIELR